MGIGWNCSVMFSLRFNPRKLQDGVIARIPRVPWHAWIRAYALGTG